LHDALPISCRLRSSGSSRAMTSPACTTSPILTDRTRILPATRKPRSVSWRAHHADKVARRIRVREDDTLHLHRTFKLGWDGGSAAVAGSEQWNEPDGG